MKFMFIQKALISTSFIEESSLLPLSLAMELPSLAGPVVDVGSYCQSDESGYNATC